MELYYVVNRTFDKTDKLSVKHFMKDQIETNLMDFLLILYLVNFMTYDSLVDIQIITNKFLPS